MDVLFRLAGTAAGVWTTEAGVWPAATDASDTNPTYSNTTEQSPPSNSTFDSNSSTRLLRDEDAHVRQKPMLASVNAAMGVVADSLRVRVLRHGEEIDVARAAEQGRKLRIEFFNPPKGGTRTGVNNPVYTDVFLRFSGICESAVYFAAFTQHRPAEFMAMWLTEVGGFGSGGPKFPSESWLVEVEGGSGNANAAGNANAGVGNATTVDSASAVRTTTGARNGTTRGNSSVGTMPGVTLGCAMGDPGQVSGASSSRRSSWWGFDTSRWGWAAVSTAVVVQAWLW